jgi:uncharacterized protein YbjQ (UPF0145 family)
MSIADHIRDLAEYNVNDADLLNRAADRIDRLEAELAEARKDALGKIDALQRLADQAQKLHMGY